MTPHRTHPGHPHAAAPAAPATPASDSGDPALVKSWSYPFPLATAQGQADPQAYFNALAQMEDGFYPLGANGIWHGGIHFGTGSSASLKQDPGVRCIADGVVVGYRLDAQYPTLTYSDGKKARYSTGFVLVHHRLVLPPVPAPATPAGTPPAALAARSAAANETLDFFSVYMHQQDWHSAQLAEKGSHPPPRPAFWQGTTKYHVGDAAHDKQHPLPQPPANITNDPLKAMGGMLATLVTAAEGDRGQVQLCLIRK